MLGVGLQAFSDPYMDPAPIIRPLGAMLSRQSRGQDSEFLILHDRTVKSGEVIDTIYGYYGVGQLLVSVPVQF